MNLKQLLEKFQQKTAEQQAILAKGEDVTAEDVTLAETLDAELEALDTEIKRLQGAEALRQKNAGRQAFLNDVERPEFKTGGNGAGGSGSGSDAAQNIVLPASMKRRKVTSFKGADAQLKAYRFGQFFLAAIVGNKKAQDYCRKNGIAITRDEKSHMEGDDSRGGFLVPEEFENDMIDLREEFGTFRKLAKVTPMRSDTKTVPRRAGGLTAYAVGEGDGITESKKAWNRVRVTARKFAVLALYSNELDEDSVIDIGDDMAKEISYAFAMMEDNCGFNGDGTGTYHGIVGFRNKFKNLTATRANIAGLVVGSSGTWANLTLPDFNKVKGRLPRYARTPNTRWVCSQTFYHEVMERLMMAAGGVTAAEVALGRVSEVFMGYPVEINQTMPYQTALDDIPVLFGDLSLAALFGDRRQTTIAMSTEYAFDQDEIAIRGTERFDINVHDIGNQAATANQRVAGPVVGLITAAA